MRVYTAGDDVYAFTTDDAGHWYVDMDGYGWRQLSRPPTPVIGENLRFAYEGGGSMMVDEVIDIEYTDDAG